MPEAPAPGRAPEHAPAYRRDIDGLRAVAVMAVIVAHAGFGFLPAGHAGVDIFFVISGFLIGGIIAGEMAQGRFSFRAFYARRARRILPALFVMLAATLPVGWLLMTPDQLRYHGGAAVSALAFLSNVWFYNRIDYFNPEAANDPLVHTWSLGIEEQFYLAAPLLMLLAFRLGRRWPAVLFGLLAAASFLAAVWIAPVRPMQAFYLIHTRAWELFAGILAALYLRSALPRPNGRPAAALAVAGLGAILAGLVLIPAEAAWPGVATLLPVVGTALVLIGDAPRGPAARLLGSAPFVAIGLISYSAYLWHQPVFSFLAIAGRAPDGAAARWAVIAGCLALAALSWKWVEQPFRRPAAGNARRRWAALWAAGLAVVVFAIGGHVTRGYPWRMSPEVLAMLAQGHSWPPTYRSCIGGRDEGERLDPERACVHGAKAPPRVAIWGDSHAAVLAQPLGQALAQSGLSVRELTVGSCIPILGLKNSALKRTEYCAVHNRKMLDHLVASPTIELVILHAFWNSYTERRDFDTRAGWVQTDSVIALPLDGRADMDDAERLAFMTRELRAEVARLTAAGKHVLLLYPLPEAGFNPPEEMARRLWRDGSAPAEMSYPAAAFEDYSRLSRQMLDAAGDGPLIHRLDLSDAFCGADGRCRVVEDGVPLLFNENHYSLAGTARIIPRLAAAVRAILGAGT
ncbi:acyltransferase family protein [Albidovulum sp.]